MPPTSHCLVLWEVRLRLSWCCRLEAQISEWGRQMRSPSRSWPTCCYFKARWGRQFSEILSQNKKCNQGWGYRSTVASWSNVCKALGSTLSPKKRKILCFLFIKSHHLISSRKGWSFGPQKHRKTLSEARSQWYLPQRPWSRCWCPWGQGGFSKT